MKRLIFALIVTAFGGAALAMPALATRPGTRSSESVIATPAVDLGNAVQVVRGKVVAVGDRLAQIELSTGRVLPVQLPANVALPLGREVVLAGMPAQGGPLLVDRVLSVR